MGRRREAAAVIAVDELELLRESHRTHRLVEIVVTGCAYACCGRGWSRRDGYEQTYRGYISTMDDDPPRTFMLVSMGVGTVSYTIAVREAEIALVEGR